MMKKTQSEQVNNIRYTWRPTSETLPVGYEAA